MKRINYILSALVIVLSVGACSSNKTKETSHESASTAEASAKANYKQSPSAKGKRTCTNKKDVRYIEVVSTDFGCAVNYTKFGTTTEIARATKDMGHCDRVSEKTQVNLVESGYRCE